MIPMTSETVGAVGVGSSAVLGGIILLLFLKLLEQCFSFRWSEGTVQRIAYATLKLCVVRCQSRLMCFLRRFHTRLLITWLRWLILALKLRDTLGEFCNGLFRGFFHKKPSFVWRGGDDGNNCQTKGDASGKQCNPVKHAIRSSPVSVRRVDKVIAVHVVGDGAEDDQRDCGQNKKNNQDFQVGAIHSMPPNDPKLSHRHP
jgi:hypothetical protein